MKHRPERTCIGCRGAFPKDEVVRIVGGPQGAVLDYREKLPGRAAYVCVRRACIEQALSRDRLGRALRTRVSPPDAEQFVSELRTAIRDRMAALIAMATKAGRTAAGLSAVEDALIKGRIDLLVHTKDLSPGTWEKVRAASPIDVPSVNVELTTAELGHLVGRELVGVVGIMDKGFARSLQHESERAKRLDK